MSLENISLKEDEVFGIIVGNEARGISLDIEKYISEQFIIKGKGMAESLNVGVALGVALFHLCSQNSY